MGDDDAGRVLFVGNSFTARNDLPGLVAGLAAAGTPRFPVDTNLISVSGASLRRHWNAGEAAAAIAAGHYDWVVLQEQSTLPLKNPRRFLENVREFAPAITEAGSHLALYMTWARREAPETQEGLSEAYEEIAREVGGVVVPVGRAWQACLAAPDTPVLHDADGSHPTLAGSFLAACVFHGSLIGPLGAEAVQALEIDLAADERRGLHEIAARFRPPTS